MSFSFQSLKHKSIHDNNSINNNNTYQCVQQTQQNVVQQKTRLIKKVNIEGFKLVDLVWIRPAEGKYKYQILVRYIDPEQPRTKRQDGSYQKIIKFGQKGVEDYVDPPYNQHLRHRNINKLKANTENPLHANFYYINLLNGQTSDVYQNFNILKKQIFS